MIHRPERMAYARVLIPFNGTHQNRLNDSRAYVRAASLSRTASRTAPVIHRPESIAYARVLIPRNGTSGYRLDGRANIVDREAALRAAGCVRDITARVLPATKFEVITISERYMIHCIDDRAISRATRSGVYVRRG